MPDRDSKSNPEQDSVPSASPSSAVIATSSTDDTLFPDAERALSTTMSLKEIAKIARTSKSNHLLFQPLINEAKAAHLLHINQRLYPSDTFRMPTVFPILLDTYDIFMSKKFSTEALESKLSSPEGRAEMVEFIFFLSNFFNNKLQYQHHISLYQGFLKKMDAVFDTIDENNLFCALKLSLDFMSLGTNIASENESKPEILRLEESIRTKLSARVDTELAKVEAQLKDKFNALELTSPDFHEQAFSGFPETEGWRLYVDGRCQQLASEAGWIGYETRENGCLNALHNAMIFTLNELDQDLSVALLLEAHKLAISPVQKISEKQNIRSGSLTSSDV